MFDGTNFITGVEIGTSKICVAIGQAKADDGLNIIGFGQVASTGVSKGEVVHPGKVAIELREALVAAEQMADVEIRQVFLGVTGDHIISQIHRGRHQLDSPEHPINADDVAAVMADALALTIPDDHIRLHSIRNHFLVDGEVGIQDPVGMHGSKLEAEMHVIHGKGTRIQNAISSVLSTSLEVEDVVFNGLASGLVVLTQEEKELGTLVIDLGAGSTEYLICYEGIIRYSGTLAVGISDVISDIAHGMKLTHVRAERLFRQYGSAAALDDETVIDLRSETGGGNRALKIAQLNAILTVRLQEVFGRIDADVAGRGLERCLRAGVVLCGGGAKISGAVALAARKFQMEVRLGGINNISGLARNLNEPELATVLGLVKFGALRQNRPRPETALRLSWKRVLSRAKGIFSPATVNHQD